MNANRIFNEYRTEVVSQKSLIGISGEHSTNWIVPLIAPWIQSINSFIVAVFESSVPPRFPFSFTQFRSLFALVIALVFLVKFFVRSKCQMYHELSCIRSVRKDVPLFMPIVDISEATLSPTGRPLFQLSITLGMACSPKVVPCDMRVYEPKSARRLE